MTNLIRASRRCMALKMPRASALAAFEDFSKSFQLRLDYPVQTTGDFIDQNLNKGEPVPSILLDQLIQTVETKKQFIDISYHLWRFRHSPFSYKMRPWTNYFLITKGVRLGAFEALIELLLKSETYGCFPDAASLSYLLLNLVENGENQLAVEACVDLLIKDLCSSSTLAKLCLNIFIHNIENLQSCEAKQVYASVRIIGNILENEKLKDLGACGIAKTISEEEVTKDDHFYIDPYVNYEELCSNPQIEFEEFIEQLKSLDLEFGSLEGEINGLFNDASETFKQWNAEATDLHQALETLVSDRKDWAARYQQLEKEFKAGVQYALSQRG
ncbi:Oidioi.mRNA.OKI2018_I69.chr1.g3877.t2.cds [Oikopleura dioica]|uniref:Oidioi.mRNA.OKI2018_I69.chr1.g3877.t2.cds n=1 Tax=Oikopleura dioica TaxID=34765 RepID=A0ABN7T4P2_OIKDI|nr:Oidioi.mRNA.OKI2018_I69.chr1.g3877.t2.cds [Oikopleura dioica]